MRLMPPQAKPDEVQAALDRGEQVLRVLRWGPLDPHGDPCEREPEVAQLFDRDLGRLVETARLRGLCRAAWHVRQRGEPDQHIELRGELLRRMYLTARMYRVARTA